VQIVQLDGIPDFSNFVREEGGELIILDDFGPGCIYRIFMPVVSGGTLNPRNPKP
jgi:hypothetical protein